MNDLGEFCSFQCGLARVKCMLVLHPPTLQVHELSLVVGLAAALQFSNDMYFCTRATDN